MMSLLSPGTFIDDLTPAKDFGGLSVVDLQRKIASLCYPSGPHTLSADMKLKTVERLTEHLVISGQLAKRLLVPRQGELKDIYGALRTAIKEYGQSPVMTNKNLVVRLTRLIRDLLNHDRIELYKWVRNELEQRGVYDDLLAAILDPDSHSSVETLTPEQASQIEMYFMDKEDSLMGHCTDVAPHEKPKILQIFQDTLKLPGKIPAVVRDRTGVKTAKFPLRRMYVEDYSNLDRREEPRNVMASLTQMFPNLPHHQTLIPTPEKSRSTGTFGLHCLFQNGFALINEQGPKKTYLSRLKDMSQEIEDKHIKWPITPTKEDLSTEVRFVRVHDVRFQGKYQPKFLTVVDFVRVLILGQEKDAYSVFLLDVGAHGSASKIGSLPSELCEMKKPLVTFAKIDGLASATDMDLVEACAGLLASLHGVEKDLGEDYEFWLRCMDVKNQYPNLACLAVRTFHKLGKERHVLAKENKSDCHKDLCIHLCQILRRDPENENAIFTLFYIMDRMPEKLLMSTYEEGNMESLISSICSTEWFKGIERELANIVDRIEDFKTVGANGYVKWDNSLITARKMRQEINNFPWTRRSGFPPGSGGRCRSGMQPRSSGKLPSLMDLPQRSPNSFPERRQPRGIPGQKLVKNQPPANQRRTDPKIQENEVKIRPQKSGLEERLPPSKYMSRLDLDPKINVTIGKPNPKFTHTIDDMDDPTENVSFNHSALLKPAKFEQDIVFVENVDKQRIEKEIVALLNSYDRTGLLLIGVSEGGQVRGIRMSRKERDIFRQNLDDVLSNIKPNVSYSSRIKPPRFIRVTNHPKDLKESDPNTSAFVVGIEIEKTSRKDIFYKTHYDNKGYFRHRGKTIEATAMNIARAEVDRQKTSA